MSFSIINIATATRSELQSWIKDNRPNTSYKATGTNATLALTAGELLDLLVDEAAKDAVQVAHDEELSMEMVAAGECEPLTEVDMAELQDAVQRMADFFEAMAQEMAAGPTEAQWMELDEFNSPSLSLAFEDCVEAEVETTGAAPCYLATVEHQVVESDVVAEVSPEPMALAAVAIAVMVWVLVEVIINGAAMVAAVSRWAYRVAQAQVKAREIAPRRTPRVSRVNRLIWAMG